MARQSEEAESDVTLEDMVLLFLFGFLFSCLAPELALGGLGALHVGVLPGFWESLSFLMFVYVFWGASGVLSAGVFIGLGCSCSEI